MERKVTIGESLQVILGDSSEEMKYLPDGSVDLIITSPPYADARKNDYGGVHPDDYVEWFRPFSQQMLRVLTDGGSLVLNIKERVVNGERSLYVYDLVRMMREEGWLWTEEYLWHKTSTAPGKWPNRFRDSWEHLYHFTKNRKFKMNQDSVRVPIGDWAKSPSENRRTAERQDSKTGSGVGLSRKGLHLRDTVYPSNVLHGPSETRNRGHSAAFPTWIPEFFIKLFSDEGDTVLDPFLGSGTTLEAAGNLQRKGIGIEYLEKYYEVALERIEKSREEKQ